MITFELAVAMALGLGDWSAVSGGLPFLGAGWEVLSKL